MYVEPTLATTKKSPDLKAPALLLQKDPAVYVVALPGKWLLGHTTPVWRLNDPMKGFQRIVNENRARQIARTVIDQERTFPNAITLASDVKRLEFADCALSLPEASKFLVVDGQHRLYAQNYSSKDAQYACIVHLNKTEQDMAELFLEINDNQKRVPSSLRWDLVRLVRPADDEVAVMTSELVLELVERKDSPFFHAIDLTGEQKEVSIKQGSLAPEIRTLINKTKKPKDLGFEEYVGILIRFFSAVRSLDPEGWGDSNGTFYKARILRALLRVLTDIVLKSNTPAALSATTLLTSLKKIAPETLSADVIRKAQGSAGVTDLYRAMQEQVFA